jgi:hypothetical protein
VARVNSKHVQIVAEAGQRASSYLHGKVPCHEFNDRAHAAHGSTHTKSRKACTRRDRSAACSQTECCRFQRRARTHFRDWRVYHTIQTVLLCKALGNFVGTVVQGDFFACKVQRRTQRQTDYNWGFGRFPKAFHAPIMITFLSRAISSSIPALRASRTVNCVQNQPT